MHFFYNYSYRFWSTVNARNIPFLLERNIQFHPYRIQSLISAGANRVADPVREYHKFLKIIVALLKRRISVIKISKLLTVNSGYCLIWFPSMLIWTLAGWCSILGCWKDVCPPKKYVWKLIRILYSESYNSTPLAIILH